ncbi:MAG: ATP-binding protein [Hamadaea sp.]|nr:ATP-binding protein [Hamadaea sp.]
MQQAWRWAIATGATVAAAAAAWFGGLAANLNDGLVQTLTGLVAAVVAAPLGAWAVAGRRSQRPAAITAQAPSPARHPAYALTPDPAADARSHRASEPRSDPGEGAHPRRLDDRDAVAIAYATEIDRVVSYLRGGVSVLVTCDGLLIMHLADIVAERAGRRAWRLRRAVVDVTVAGPPIERRAELMAALHTSIGQTGPDDVVILSQFDLLSGGTDPALRAWSGELADLLYEWSDRVVLAFCDPSNAPSGNLARRFTATLQIGTLPRLVTAEGGRAVAIGQALVTQAEADTFVGFDPADLYRGVVGLNAIQLRQALRFAYLRHHTAGARQATVADLLLELRSFGARTDSAVGFSNVSFADIGGYNEVKRELHRSLMLLGAGLHEAGLPRAIVADLVPRALLFHGPTGTGKSLFAKAVASQLDAAVVVAQGPELLGYTPDATVAKLDALFAGARRDAPCVVIIEEIDAIAAGPTTGPAAASHDAAVGRLAAELDAFRPDQPVLLIGITSRLAAVSDRLLRPSRFRPIRLDLPDLAARRDITRLHARALDIHVSDELVDLLAEAAEGMTGDDLAAVFRQARAGEIIDGQPATPRRLGQILGELRRKRSEQDR